MKEILDLLKKYTDGKQNTEKVEISVLQLNRVIKALEQEPCEDAISRKYLLDNCVVDKVTMPYVPAIKIENAPPVNPQPCDAAISRQWLMECVNEGWIKFDTEKDKNRFIHLVRDIAPPATPQPRIGRWVLVEDMTDWFDATFECSCCKRAVIVPYDVRNEVYKEYPYCHCGAKMVESQERSE